MLPGPILIHLYTDPNSFQATDRIPQHLINETSLSLVEEKLLGESPRYIYSEIARLVHTVYHLPNKMRWILWNARMSIRYHPHISDEEYYMLYCCQLQEVVGALENRVTIITNYNLV